MTWSVTTEFDKQRQHMVDDQIVARGIRTASVAAALRRVRRHAFVDPGFWSEAYDDHPLSIGHRQTISQPYMVALMTEELEVEGAHRVLEVGTGSGYQTAILAELAGDVFTVERIEALSRQATLVLEDEGYRNVHHHVGDGSLGWPEEAPFDRIIVTAGGPKVPSALVSQLAMGGRLVIPVGSSQHQHLVTVTRDEKGVHERRGGACVFVKLIGEQGWD